MKGLSIVIPAHNEEPNLEATIREVSDVAQRLGIDYEILVVNDGDPQGFQGVALLPGTTERGDADGPQLGLSRQRGPMQ